nr:alcohol dehydrogenase catalytic domain-containing protein [Spiroplasma chinense]
MKAIVIKKYTKKPVSISEIQTPSIGDNEVLVEIMAASLNPIDSKIKTGSLKIVFKYKMPLILGNDFSGVVKEVGKKVVNFKVGDEVYGRPSKSKIGTFAEYLAIDENELALKPKNLTFEQAASLRL